MIDCEDAARRTVEILGEAAARDPLRLLESKGVVRDERADWRLGVNPPTARANPPRSYLKTVTRAVRTLPRARPRMNPAMSTARVARNRRLARAVSRSKSSTIVEAVAWSGHGTT